MVLAILDIDGQVLTIRREARHAVATTVREGFYGYQIAGDGYRGHEQAKRDRKGAQSCNPHSMFPCLCLG
ncbi:hypothetical protein GCM10011408_12600 [Dyella caseinilytica]|nr:hypothetical protein GCM10011408_12600 [Dyella caseinilytica]